MNKFLWKILINSVAFYLVFIIVPSLKLDSPIIALLAGLVLAIINITIRPLLIIITSPLILITFGLFTLIINTWMVMLTDILIVQLSIQEFWVSLIVSLIISIMNATVNKYKLSQKIISC